MQVGFSRSLADILTDAQQIADNMKDDVHLDRASAARHGVEQPQRSATAGAPRHRLQRRHPGAGLGCGNQRVTSDNPEASTRRSRSTAATSPRPAQGQARPGHRPRRGEIRRVVQILSRRSKNNPVLIGEPGVGKTAIVEGLAQRIVGRRAQLVVTPGRRALDMGALVAGAKYRGGSRRSKGRSRRSKPRAHHPFIDELHTWSAAAPKGHGRRPTCSSPCWRGELHAIGATTLDEYRKHIEKDAALERRFQPVFVGEPSVEDTVSILRGLKERYEVHHGVHITDGAGHRRRDAEQPLHHRPLPARQGHRPHRRGRQPAAHEIDSKPQELDDHRRRSCSWRSSARR